MVPATKIWSKAGMVHLVGRHANRMGSSGMFEVGSRCASFLDNAAVLGCVADVPPAGDHAAASPSLASLDQGCMGHLIWDKVCVTFTI